MRRKGQRGETAYRNTTSRSRNIIASLFGSEAAIVWRHCKWRLTDMSEKLGKSSFTCCTPALSNVQKNTVGGNSRDTVLKLRPYPLEFAGYSAWRRRIGRRRRKRRNPKTTKDVFYALAPFHFEERFAFACVHCTLSTHLFHSPMLVSVER